MSLPKTELEKLNHIDCLNIAGRAIPLLPYWDGESWHGWVIKDNQLIDFHPHDVRQGEYFGVKAAEENDIILPFIEFFWQHASWPDLFMLYYRISDDIQNLLTSLAKIDHFFITRDSIGSGVSFFVATEIEYLITVSRSIFDLLQEIISVIWKTHIILIDQNAQQMKDKMHLPKSFKDILITNNRLRTKEEIIAKYHFIDELASFYSNIGEFFFCLRSYRDDLIHLGVVLDYIYSTEKGFCVDIKRKPFSLFNIWKDEYKYNDHIYSLRPFLAHIMCYTIGSCNAFIDVIRRTIQFPEPLTSKCRVYNRYFNNSSIITYFEVSRNNIIWWSIE